LIYPERHIGPDHLTVSTPDFGSDALVAAGSYYAAAMRFDVPDAVKRVTKQDLVDLSGKARDLHLGVGRRADWLTERLADGSAGALRADLRELSPQLCYRCLIVIRRNDETIEHFSLDVLPDDFDRLPDVTGDALLRLTRWALNQIPISPLPTEYQVEWDAHRQAAAPRDHR
jgi:hypothetical protein